MGFGLGLAMMPVRRGFVRARARVRARVLRRAGRALVRVCACEIQKTSHRGHPKPTWRMDGVWVVYGCCVRDDEWMVHGWRVHVRSGRCRGDENLPSGSICVPRAHGRDGHSSVCRHYAGVTPSPTDGVCVAWRLGAYGWRWMVYACVAQHGCPVSILQ